MSEQPNVHRKINLNLDTYEREEAFEPYVIVLSEREIVLTDPADLDWKELVEVGTNPVRFLRYVVTDEEREHIVAQRIPGWKMRALIDSYLAHYGLDLSEGKDAASLI